MLCCQTDELKPDKKPKTSNYEEGQETAKKGCSFLAQKLFFCGYPITNMLSKCPIEALICALWHALHYGFISSSNNAQQCNKSHIEQ